MHTRVVLLLAHDGIAQPRAWERWERAHTGGPPLRIFVHCPPRAACAFAASRRLAVPFGRTRWGEASIVRETLRALGAVLAAEGAPFLLFLASGSCLPVQPPSALFAWPYETRFGKAFVRDAPKREVAPQWMCMTREDCAALVERLTPRAAFARAALRSAQYGGCADNMMFVEALPDARRGVPTTFDEALDMQARMAEVPVRHLWMVLLDVNTTRLWASPIEWSGADQPLQSARTSAALGRPGDVWTLRMLLLALRTEGTTLFMRKVSPAAVLDDTLLQQLYGDVGREALEAALAAASAAASGEEAAAAACVATQKLARTEVYRQFRRGPYHTEMVALMGALLSRRLGCARARARCGGEQRSHGGCDRPQEAGVSRVGHGDGAARSSPPGGALRGAGPRSADARPHGGRAANVYGGVHVRLARNASDGVLYRGGLRRGLKTRGPLC